MERLVKRGVLGLLVAVTVMAFAGVAPAFAESPWWNLSSGSHPAYLHAGSARNEVQELKVTATKGDVLVEGAGEFAGKFAAFPYAADPEVVQTALENIYGVGSVNVSGGRGNATGSEPYVVAFQGPLGDQPVAPINTQFSNLACDFHPTEECLEGEASTVESTAGRPDGEIVLTAANLGEASTNGEVRIGDELPSGLRAVSIVEATYGNTGEFHEALECSVESARSVGCAFTGGLLPYQLIEVTVGVDMQAGAATGEVNEMSVSGGGASPASARHPIIVNGATTPFGVEDYELTPEEEGGTVDTQAGSHPFQLTTTITLNQTAEGNPVALAKDLNFKLPPGLIGNPQPFPQCTVPQFFSKTCEPKTAVGVAMSTLLEPQLTGNPRKTVTVPIFNLEPSPGEPARFGFYPAHVPVFLDASVRTGGDYGVTISVDNITQSIGFVSNKVTFWGVPGDPRHDQQRGWECLQAGESNNRPCQPLEESSPSPFLTLPTSCPQNPTTRAPEPLQSAVEADAWKQQGVFGSPLAASEPPALDGCNRLAFDPSIEVKPDGQAASTPTGLTVDVHVPQAASLSATGLADSDLESVSVALPAGLQLNPAAADGLQACTQAQIALQSDTEQSCPEASKIGNATIKTPLLANALKGGVYLASPQNFAGIPENPFSSLVAMYVVAYDPVSGVRVKLAGKVSLNEATGQVLATFENNPQLPFEDAELEFFGGERAPLATPAHCGTYTTNATLAPWSGDQPAGSQSSFEITSGPNHGSCENPSPFAPSLTAGTTDNQAGGFSPLTTTVSREDGQQNIQGVQLQMPPGLSGVLSGVKLCGEAQANAGTCGPESLIGHTIVSVGLGGDPFSVTGGQVFLTEGYEGAPFGLSIVDPAVAGPFNLGVVVVRAKVEVDPDTTALTVTTNPSGPYSIPHILDGIPLQIKHVSVTIDRSGFTFNPTNCSPQVLTGTIGSVEGATSPVAVPFQATNCATLKFQPTFTASTSGKTSRASGASLAVKLTFPKTAQGTEANIARVKVDLPKQLPSRLTTLQKACTAKQFEANPAGCPAASIVGHARAITSILPVPLEGPAYFVSHGGEGFPSLILVLQGYGVKIDLVGTTFISKAGITSSTFKTVPDQPVTSFELTLPTGPYSALAANLPASAHGSLCGQKLAMPTEFLAQNGAKITESTAIGVSGCAKTKALTRAQRLTKALKACKTHHGKSKRAQCEAKAHKQYALVGAKRKAKKR